MDLTQCPFALVTTDRSLTRKDAAVLIESNVPDLVEELRSIAPTAALSTMLTTQLAWLRAGQYCAFGGNVCRFDYRVILDEIAHLEDQTLPTGTGPATKFTGLLSQFWHKHFCEPQFLAKNLANETEQSFDRLFYCDFAQASERELGRNWNGLLLDDHAVGLLTYTLLFGALNERSGNNSKHAVSRMTGEWIVFMKHKGKNLYLTLAVHKETDQSIINRLGLCAEEFPNIGDLLTPHGS